MGIQRQVTGIAISGKPSLELKKDPKFQGEYKSQSILAGERVALAALSAEYFVLSILGIESSEQYKYIGRSQYPKFRRQPIVARSSDQDDRYASGEVRFWSELLNNIQSVIEGLVSDVETVRPLF